MIGQRCELCNKPFFEGDDVRVTMKAVFHKAVAPLHALDPYEEIRLIHGTCGEDSND